MKKFWKGVALAISLVLAASFAGCSSDGEEEEGKITSVTISESSLTLVSDDETSNSTKLTATVVGTASDKTVNWTTSNESVATVSNDGTVTAVAEGSAKITATSKFDSLKYAVCEVTVISKALKNLAENSAGTYTIGDTTIVISSDGKISATDSEGNAVEVSVDFSDDTVTITVGENSYTASLTEEGGIDTSSVKDSEGNAVEVEYTTEGEISYYVGIGADTSTMSLSSVKVNNEEKLSAATTVTTSWTGYKVDELSDENWTVAFTFKMTEVGTSNWTDFNWEIRNNNDQSYWGGRYDNYMVGWLTGYYSYGAWGDNDADTLSAGAAYGGHWYNVGTNTLAYDHSETLDKTCVLTFQKLAYGIKATLTSEGTEVWSCINPLYGFEKSLESIKLDTENVQKTFTTGATIDSTGLKVTAIYDDESTLDVSASENLSVSADLSSSGTKSVTVSYTESGVTKTATYEVEVTDTVVLSSISVDTTSAKTSFAVGDTFTSDGLAVTAKYSDGNTRDVSASAAVDESGVTNSTAGTYTVTVSYTEGDVTKTTEYSVVVQAILPYTVSGSIAKDTVVPPLAVTSETGASVSFWLGSDYDSDVKFLFTSTTAKIGAAIDYYTDGVWTNGMYPGVSGTLGADFSSVTTPHTIFLNNASYVTISFNADKSISYYKNGKLAVTYVSTAEFTNNADGATAKTAADVWTAFVTEVAKEGLTLNPNGFTLTNVTINAAVSDTTAQTAFNEAVQTIASIAVNPTTTEFTAGGTFSFKGTITATDSSENTFALSEDFVTLSEPDLSAAADSVAVTVTLNGKTSVTTNYNIKVVSADSVTVPTAVYSARLDGSDTGVEIVGAGSYVEDETFTKVFKNDGSAQRTSYLLLPSDTLQHSATSKEMTIGFWVNNTTDDTVIYHPLFSAYAQKNDTNTYPMFILQSRGLAQVNCAGFCDFGAVQNDAGSNAESIEWLGEKGTWHYYTCVMTETSLKVYADGTIINSWTIDGTSEGQVLSGMFTSTELVYVCLGGNQAWNWTDNDAPYSFAKFSVWDSALSAAQINKVITTTKNSD